MEKKVQQSLTVPNSSNSIESNQLQSSVISGNRPPVPPVSSLSNKNIISTDSKIINNNFKIVQCKSPIVVRDFALLLGMKPFRLISELMEMGIFASMNQVIDEITANKIAEKHKFLLEIKHRGAVQKQDQIIKPKVKKLKRIEKKIFLEPRPPVVCVLGHVDHGKTTLLDNIRNTNIVSKEAGGITQHMGAYQIIHKKNPITFIDTPGHAAFTTMRERGANITDIAVLVVAADDGFMTQTDEALKFAQKAKVPIIVAINKIDTCGANIDRVKEQLQKRNITSEDWGGETLTTSISALKGKGISDLLDLILLQAEIMELKANYKGRGEGVIIESQIEKGRGSTGSVIIKHGTVKTGDALVCDSQYCKVRAMYDDSGDILKRAFPSKPVKIIGWSSVPKTGHTFEVVNNEKKAKYIAENNFQEKDKENKINKNCNRIAEANDLLININKKQNKTRLQLTAYFDRKIGNRNNNVFCISFVNVNSLQQALVLNYVV